MLLKVGSFKATSYEELFEKAKALDWENYIPENGKFWIAKAASVKSKLFSPSDIQSVMKKAMVRRLQQKYHVEWFEEDGVAYPVRVFLKKDVVTVGIIHREYHCIREGIVKLVEKAPITETLAAALIMLTPWHKDRILVDPFLRKWNISYRSSDDRSKYRTRNEPVIYSGRMDESDSKEALV